VVDEKRPADNTRRCANADIMTTFVECVRERVMQGARTFMVKVKAHRGEPLKRRGYLI
jgi:hypothetical protein